jgi:hypothetical protein
MGGFSPVVNLAEKVGAVKKSAEQPKVPAQMNNSNQTGNDGPTSVEMNQTADNILKNKRRGRSSTILTLGSNGSSLPTLGKKSLLG